MSKLIPYSTIIAATQGDGDALADILRHYAPYILSFSKHSFYDDYGHRSDIVDDELRHHIESRLMLQIICKFDPKKIPDGETLQVF